eukprot:TRINITY_DN8147_c0_g1_i31.p2 TRINITY_DN8147_c0_g1~~TRINITY_DN8147_c0_g1_i31.p2  ORF type:complete len:218 (-),score=91.20 TRINITY_DN8147_c0_g1_i31:45-698(-)
MEVSDDVQVKGEVTEAEHKKEEAPEPPKPEAPKEEPKKTEAPAGKVLATPAVRNLAMEMKVDLAKVAPTGKGGRITKEDVLKYAEGTKAGAKAGAGASSQPAVAKAAPVVVLEQDRVVKLTGVRRAMAKSMTDALKIPPYNLQEEMCIEKIKKMKEDYIKANPKMKMTYLPFFLKAFSQAMVKYPIFNAVSNPVTDKEGYITAVSYTHLTLPTICSV